MTDDYLLYKLDSERLVPNSNTQVGILLCNIFLYYIYSKYIITAFLIIVYVCCPIGGSVS